MQYITSDDLKNLGITLSEKNIQPLLDHLNTQLEERVGTEIIDALDDAKLEQYLSLKEQGNDKAAGDWLAKNVAELPEIAQDETNILLGEVAENVEELNKNS